jgi:hypothetical protein
MRSQTAALILLCTGSAVAQELRHDTTGFYPIWENTGYVERSGDVRLGTTGAQVGLGEIAHAGVQPLNFIYRSPNAYLKFALFSSARWHVAIQGGGYRLLAGASRASFSPMYSSRIDNVDFALTLIPVSVSASLEVASWLELHQTLTAMAVLSPGPVRNGITPGYSAVAELNPHGRHAISLHAGEVGFWAHDLTVAGASYRYRNSWMEFRLGYFYRFGKSGGQSAPLAAFGILL